MIVHQIGSVVFNEPKRSQREVMEMQRCVVCHEEVPEDLMAGEICQFCVEHHDEWGVYFILGSE